MLSSIGFLKTGLLKALGSMVGKKTNKLNRERDTKARIDLFPPRFIFAFMLPMFSLLVARNTLSDALQLDHIWRTVGEI